jgi:hypothetical protein
MTLFADQTRDELRRFYLEVWRKHQERAPLEPLEAQIAAVITDHPEYVPLLESGEDALKEEFLPESGRVNPFMHMALHQVLREQVATDRPPGIAQQHRRLTKKLKDSHAAEHAMAGVLAEMMWEMLTLRREADMSAYLERLRRL